MFRVLKISFRGATDSFRLHEFKNFGEKIYREFRDEFDVSIHEIDQSKNDFYIRKIHKRDVRAAVKRVQKIAETDKATPFVEITEVDDEK